MKTSKSPESTEVTPSKKKLKQARLPFKLISEVSPVPVTPPSRKRKLSATDADPAPKGKITKENDIDIVESLVISDDDEGTADTTAKQPNPYARLVSTAIKKKQKSKGKKKKKGKQSLSEVEENNTAEIKESDNEVMDVDEPADEIVTDDKETELVNKEEIVVLEDSNCSVDAQQKDDKLPDQSISDKSTDEPEKKVLSEEKSVISAEEPDKSNRDTNVDDKIKVPITPKRSTRNKAKEENNNKGSPSSKLNDSTSSDSTTPRQRSAAANDESNVTPNANLTPKQVQKKLESAKKREKLEKEKQEREKKRQEEKDERAKQRQEKEDQRKKEREEKEEAKRKEREEKEELRKKEKEDKEKQKEVEKKLREDKEEQKRKEKEEKEEQRKKEKEAREEEKRKRQEAAELEKHEQEAKKKKAAEAFANFFVPKQKTEKDQPTVGAVNNSMLTSFTLKADMRLAPTTRVQLSKEQVKGLEKLMKEQSIIESELYVKALKNGVKGKSCGKTWPLSDKDDVILIEDELPPSDGAGEIISCDLVPREKLRPKLFSFHENRRPPYWGTWRKKSAVVKPRTPFGQDEKQLDYEVDSDEDWEEEQEGESLDGSAAGSDDEQEPNDEYEVDNEVFVPHGYLSDEEATMDEDDVLSLSPETQKARLKHLEDEFESEMKKPTEKLKPRLYGLLWESGEGGKPENCVDAIWNYFGKLAMIMNDPTPLLQPSKEPEETEKKKVKKKKPAKDTEGNESSPKTDKKKKVKRSEEKEAKPTKTDKKSGQDLKKNQPVINMFLKKKQSL